MVLKMLVIEAKKQRRRTLKFVPYLLTYLNACCGFLAVVCALQDHFSMAGWFIGCAVLCDMFDGRVARALGSASFLGAELDALADGVSFCFAPSLLLYVLYQDVAPLFLLISLLLFLCAGLFRLARFNVQQPRSDGGFCGLPTPLAALVISFIVIQNHSFFNERTLLLPNPYHIGLLAIGLALLMISKIPFPTCKTTFVSRQGITLALIIAGGSILVYWGGCSGLLMGPVGYIVGAISLWIIRSIMHQGRISGKKIRT